jgi:phosphotriesterase-related protein
MDRFGVEVFCAFEQRIGTVAELCRRGYASRMVLSHDANCGSNHMPEDVLERPEWVNWKFTHISDDVLPALRAAGVSDADLHTMLVTNPREILDR